MTFGSLFSGIGGLDLGLERAGMVCKWQVEIDPYCRKVLEKHWPDVPKFGDIREVDFTQVEPVDLICGGFPCQPFSVAGRREGEKDERYLWPEFARAIGEARPRIVLLENVPGLLSIDSGRVFGRVLADLAALGFDAEWDCIPAAAVGAPHRRYRLFVVAYSDGMRKLQSQGCVKNQRGRIGYSPETSLANVNSEGRQNVERGQGSQAQRGGIFNPSCVERPNPSRHWEVEPGLDGLVHGISAPMDGDRVSAGGRAVVPQVAEWLGKRIMEAEVAL